MATTITKSNLFSEARNNIVDIVKANVSDPISSSSEYRKWIYSREPDFKDAGFKGFPVIIIYPSEVDIPTDRKSLDLKSKWVNWTIEVEVISSDRGNGSGGGNGLSHMDSISNSILEVLNDKTNLNTLISNRLHNLTFSTSGVSTEPLADELVYRRTFIVNMNTKMQMSS